MEKKLEIINVIEYNIIGMKWWLILFFTWTGTIIAHWDQKGTGR